MHAAKKIAIAINFAPGPLINRNNIKKPAKIILEIVSLFAKFINHNKPRRLPKPTYAVTYAVEVVKPAKSYSYVSVIMTS